jgi:hypothetical protein
MHRTACVTCKHSDGVERPCSTTADDADRLRVRDEKRRLRRRIDTAGALERDHHARA